MNKDNCDLESGLCAPSDMNEEVAITPFEVKDRQIIYVGDPMCSWCWGISPELRQLKEYYESKDIAFNVVVGGLRPGGGDPWDDQMKDFLAHHWDEVHKKTGQPFKYDLMNLEDFQYDTEPACRAVVTARSINPAVEFDFFEKIQYKFYAESKDPNDIEFYESICNELKLDFEKFTSIFNSSEVIEATNEEFMANRSWGVKGYPTVLFYCDERLYLLSNGFTTFEILEEGIEGVLSGELIED